MTCKLTEADVLEVWRLWCACGWGQKAIALYVGVSQPVISNILCGKTWRHVPRPVADQTRTEPVQSAHEARQKRKGYQGAAREAGLGDKVSEKGQ